MKLFATMLAAETASSQPASGPLVEYVLLGIGVICTIGIVAYLLRGKRWRDPLQFDKPIAPPIDMRTTLLLASGSFALAKIIPPLVALFIYPPEGETLPEPGETLWHLQFTMDAMVSLAAAILLVWIVRRFPLSMVPFGRKIGWLKFSAVVVGATLVITTLATAQQQALKIIWQIAGWEDPQHEIISTVVAGRENVWIAVQLLVAAVVVAPIVEELFFRGVLLHLLARNSGSVWLAILISGAIFGLVHFSAPTTVLPLCTFGFVLGYVRVRYNSLTMCILAHMLFNAKTMALVIALPEFVPKT